MTLTFPGPEAVKRAKEIFDFEELKSKAIKSFSWVDDELQAARLRVEKAKVDTPEQAEQMTQLLGQAQKLKKRMESKRKQAIEKPDDYVRSVNRFVKSYRDKIDDLIRAGKKKIGVFHQRQELKRREEEKRLREEQAKIQRELDAAAEKSGVEKVTLQPAAIPKKTTPIRTEAGTASARMVWKHNVVDESKVPREYLSVDDKKIAAAIRAGIREISGVEIFEEADVRVRVG